VKILVIGGTGLISTSITRFLLEQGEQVIHYNRSQRAPSCGARPPTIIGDRKN
jgi:uncharacterized protein YbjT (DUF2867 family)